LKPKSNNNLSKKVPKRRKKKKIDYRLNHEIIQRKIIEFVKRTGRVPTRNEIAQECQLNEKTIDRHFVEMQLPNLLPQFKTLTPLVMAGIYNNAKDKGGFNAKLWLQVVEGWTEKINIDHKDKSLNLDSIFAKLINDKTNPKWEEYLRRLASGENSEQVLLEYERTAPPIK